MVRGLFFSSDAPLVLWDLSNFTDTQIEGVLQTLLAIGDTDSEYDWGGLRLWCCTEGPTTKVEDLGRIDDDFEVSTEAILDTLQRLRDFRQTMTTEQAQREVDHGFKLIAMNPELNLAQDSSRCYEIPRDGFHLRLKT